MNKTIVLILIVLCQFFGTSLWFSSNAILGDLAVAHQLDTENLLSSLTIATQIGFIAGTLIYTLFNISDRFPAHNVFSISVFIAAVSNVVLIFDPMSFQWIWFFRFLVGFFLAGVYPVGMKIASYYFPKTLSKALGLLVGALVLGTAFPHGIYSLNLTLSWKYVLICSSTLAFLGALLILPLKTPALKNFNKIDFSIIPSLFKNPNFKKAAIGYFGHMWELYALWAFFPVLIENYINTHALTWNVSSLSFISIAIGTLGCIIMGRLALQKGSFNMARLSLIVSGICCLLVPFSTQMLPYIFIIYVLIWGFFVIADSALFSSLVSQHSIPEYRGTGLTLSTCIGFTTTIVCIYSIKYLLDFISIEVALTILFLGPLVGVWQLRKS